jgi:superfamily II DNA or RNA helicase
MPINTSTFIHTMLKTITAFNIDRSQLEKNMLLLDERLRNSLPRRPAVITLKLMNSLGHNITVTLHNNHNLIAGPGVREFFSPYLLTEAPETDFNGIPHCYLVKLPTPDDWYVVFSIVELQNSKEASGLIDLALVRQKVEELLANHAESFLQFTPASTKPESDSLRPLGFLANLDPKLPEMIHQELAGKQSKNLKMVPIKRTSSLKTTTVNPPKKFTTSTKLKPAESKPVSKPVASVTVNPSPDLQQSVQEVIKTQLLQLPPQLDIPVDEASEQQLLTLLAAGRFESAAAWEIHEQAITLSMRPGFDQLLSLEVVHNITPFSYQINAVKEVLRRMRGRAILADEVGLGKTIEAGLIMMEYILRGLVRRVLVLCPPPLITQWQEELKFKFNLEFIASDTPEFLARKNPWQDLDLIIASIDTAKKEPLRELLHTVPFDLVIVDEAHRCRNKNTLNWKLINGLVKKYLLLLTATPVQNDLQELFNLITLVRPGQLATAAEFTRNFITRGDQLKPKNTPALRNLMREIMIRNRRETCGLVFPKRRAETVTLTFTPEEAAFYNGISELIRLKYNTGLPPANLRLILKTLQKEVGSSPAAVLLTLAKLLDSEYFSDSREAISRLITLGQKITTTVKANALVKLLQTCPDKVLVFTGYLATLNYLNDYLSKAGLAVATFSGEMNRRQKEQAIESFKTDAKILLATESGGEGRNLQFCHLMVNYDLPWNPMRIEQRIGRLHRIGQSQEVYIFNFAVTQTLEAQILELLDAKINLFELVVGELDMILGNIETEADFEDTILDLWGHATTDEELNTGFQTLGRQLAEAKVKYTRYRDYEDELFGAELASAGVNDHGT